MIRALGSLGLTDVSRHTMRHTGVTLMLEHGINPRAIQFSRAGRRGCWISTATCGIQKYDAVTTNADHVAATATKATTVPNRPSQILKSENGLTVNKSGCYRLASPTIPTWNQMRDFLQEMRRLRESGISAA